MDSFGSYMDPEEMMRQIQSLASDPTFMSNPEFSLNNLSDGGSNHLTPNSIGDSMAYNYANVPRGGASQYEFSRQFAGQSSSYSPLQAMASNPLAQGGAPEPSFGLMGRTSVNTSLDERPRSGLNPPPLEEKPHLEGHLHGNSMDPRGEGQPQQHQQGMFSPSGLPSFSTFYQKEDHLSEDSLPPQQQQQPARPPDFNAGGGSYSSPYISRPQPGYSPVVRELSPYGDMMQSARFSSGSGLYCRDPFSDEGLGGGNPHTGPHSSQPTYAPPPMHMYGSPAQNLPYYNQIGPQGAMFQRCAPPISQYSGPLSGGMQPAPRPGFQSYPQPFPQRPPFHFPPQQPGPGFTPLSHPLAQSNKYKEDSMSQNRADVYKFEEDDFKNDTMKKKSSKRKIDDDFEDFDYSACNLWYLVSTTLACASGSTSKRSKVSMKLKEDAAIAENSNCSSASFTEDKSLRLREISSDLDNSSQGTREEDDAHSKDSQEKKPSPQDKSHDSTATGSGEALHNNIKKEPQEHVRGNETLVAILESEDSKDECGKPEIKQESGENSLLHPSQIKKEPCSSEHNGMCSSGNALAIKSEPPDSISSGRRSCDSQVDVNIPPMTIFTYNGSPVTQGMYAHRYLAIEQKLSMRLREIQFRKPCAYIYNPLVYAFEVHQDFVRRFFNSPKPIMFLGMNPGPFGMVQNAIPFGEVSIVRDWLQVQGHVYKPVREHPKRPLMGLHCHRSEISGSRFWNFFRRSCHTPETFFRHCLVHNLCPLAFMAPSGRNITPPDLCVMDRTQLNDACAQTLLEVVEAFQVETIVAIGRYVEEQALKALKNGNNTKVKVHCLQHPSPLNPQANKGWDPVAYKTLTDLKVFKLITGKDSMNSGEDDTVTE